MCRINWKASACPLTKSDVRSLDYVISRFFVKLFQTTDRRKYHKRLSGIFCSLSSKQLKKILSQIDHDHATTKPRNCLLYALGFTRTPPVEAHRPVVTYLQFPIQFCFLCNDHAQPAADKAPISRSPIDSSNSLVLACLCTRRVYSA